MFLKPRILLRLEGAAVLALGLYFYRATGAHWGLFLLLFLWPDLFMLGYLISVRVGSNSYNLVHNYVFPLALLGFAIFTQKPQLLPFALIWISHIGFDRALGYGLKYPTFFKYTHLQRVN
jgi:hypothetical protein